MNEKNRYEIVYDSDFIIDDPVELSTLCVFYDKVYLPWSGSNIGGIEDWDIGNNILFNEGVFQRCSKDESPLTVPFPPTPKLEGALRQWFEKSNLVGKANGRGTAGLYVYIDFVGHLLRSDITLPRLSTESSRIIPLEVKKKLLAEQTFRYVLPTISERRPEQLLELRRKVADVREGFSMHLQKLTNGIDLRMKGGETFDDIQHYAKEVINANLLQDYSDFKKLVSPENVSVGGKIFAIGGSLLTAYTMGDLSPLLVAMGLGAELIAKQSKDLLTNQSQTFQFMHRIESSELNR